RFASIRKLALGRAGLDGQGRDRRARTARGNHGRGPRPRRGRGALGRGARSRARGRGRDAAGDERRRDRALRGKRRARGRGDHGDRPGAPGGRARGTREPRGGGRPAHPQRPVSMAVWPDRIARFDPFAAGVETLRYVLLDVFTAVPLTGNQLAVFTDGRALTAPTMQAIAAELKLSETVFLLPPEQGGDARARI